MAESIMKAFRLTPEEDRLAKLANINVTEVARGAIVDKIKHQGFPIPQRSQKRPRGKRAKK